jgi:hypothetical protein
LGKQQQDTRSANNHGKRKKRSRKQNKQEKKKVKLLASMLHNVSTTLCNHDYNKLSHSFKHDCCPNLKAINQKSKLIKINNKQLGALCFRLKRSKIKTY